MYKILLPVSSPAYLVQEKLKDLKGLEDKTIVLNNWTDPATEIQVKEFAARGAEAYNCTYNLGLGASWNFGMKRMMEDGDDFVIILSASAVFDKDIRHFIDAIIKEEQLKNRWRYICGTASLHCFAHTRIGVEEGGYLDENFWPIYNEDTDYCYRSSLHDRVGLSTKTRRVKNLNQNNVVHSLAFSVACNAKTGLLELFQHNSNRQVNYYQRKWGGYQNSEIYIYPFNDPSIGINDWKVEEGFHHPAFSANWNPPSPSVRY